MVDIRFHASAEPSKLSAILGQLKNSTSLDDARAFDLLVHGAAELISAGPNHIALAAHQSYSDALRDTEAGAVVVSPALRDIVPKRAVPIVHDRPHELFVDILEVIYPSSTRAVTAATLSPGPEPIFEGTVRIGANVVIGPGAEIGDGTIIGPNTVIGAGVAIGRNCTIGSNCTVDCAYIGNNVVLHPGARIGTEGFGWLDFGLSNRKIPQLGRVILQDGVEVGANTTIDRGALGDTVIGEGTKVDNLVQIGHNCRIGRNCLIAGACAIAGSTIIEDGVLLGGGVGIAGHLTIGAGSVVYGRSGITKSWPAGSKLFGAPAQDVKTYWREQATLRRLAKEKKG